MKKVLVVGSQAQMDEFRQLPLKNCKVKYLPMDLLASQSLREGLVNLGMNMNEDVLDEGLMLLEKPYEGEDVLKEFEPDDLDRYDIVFDLSLDVNQQNLEFYAERDHLTVFGTAVVHTLAEMESEYMGLLEFTFFGINGLPGFINRPRLEVSLLNAEDRESLDETLAALGMEADVVADRTGMVSARVVCMIINEACFMVQEGTAGMAEIDQAMKLGTAYPMGPFEWADKIGVDQVHNVIASLFQDQQDPKYRMAPLLRERHLKGLPMILED